MKIVVYIHECNICIVQIISGVMYNLDNVILWKRRDIAGKVHNRLYKRHKIIPKSTVCVQDVGCSSSTIHDRHINNHYVTSPCSMTFLEDKQYAWSHLLLCPFGSRYPYPKPPQGPVIFTGMKSYIMGVILTQNSFPK